MDIIQDEQQSPIVMQSDFLVAEPCDVDTENTAFSSELYPISFSIRPVGRGVAAVARATPLGKNCP